MTENRLALVVTTVQPPTPAVVRLASAAASVGARFVVIGDTKTPAGWRLDGVDYLDVEAQRALPWALARALPTRHYARKNLGYLVAFAGGASMVYETDDDNAPLPSWAPRGRVVAGARAALDRGWFNPYQVFGEGLLWPRGLPLQHIRSAGARVSAEALPPTEAPIQQGLANGSPDVDAVWRMVCDRDVRFADGPPIVLPPSTWCPFNSQSTWWTRDVLPLLYLPSHCSFRMTDIWRSFVAQRCLWTTGAGVVFHGAEVEQERNAHELIRDFRDEVPGYRDNTRIVALLERLALTDGAHHADNLRASYAALVAEGIFPADELALVDAWLEACTAVAG